MKKITIELSEKELQVLESALYSVQPAISEEIKKNPNRHEELIKFKSEIRDIREMLNEKIFQLWLQNSSK